MLAGSTHAAGAQQPSGLPGDPALEKRPALQQNRASAGIRLQKLGADDVSELSMASFGGDGPSTPILDTFTRPNAGNLCINEPAWVCNDPLGGPWVLSVFAQQAGTPDNVTRVSYRHQNYPGDVELYALIPVKPANGGGVSLVFNVRLVPGGNWDDPNAVRHMTEPPRNPGRFKVVIRALGSAAVDLRRLRALVRPAPQLRPARARVSGSAGS